jgi:hypothetical protein
LSNPSSSRVSSSGQARWIERVESLKQVARAEVKSGYLTCNKGKGRAVSSPAAPWHTATSSTSSAPPVGKPKGKGGLSGMEPVRGIYFVDHAHEGMSTVSAWNAL